MEAAATTKTRLQQSLVLDAPSSSLDFVAEPVDPAMEAKWRQEVVAPSWLVNLMGLSPVLAFGVRASSGIASISSQGRIVGRRYVINPHQLQMREDIVPSLVVLITSLELARHFILHQLQRNRRHYSVHYLWPWSSSSSLAV